MTRLRNHRVLVPIAERRMRAKMPSECPLMSPSASKVSASSGKKLTLKNFSHRLGLTLKHYRIKILRNKKLSGNIPAPTLPPNLATQSPNSYNSIFYLTLPFQPTVPRLPTIQSNWAEAVFIQQIFQWFVIKKENKN